VTAVDDDIGACRQHTRLPPGRLYRSAHPRRGGPMYDAK
jgi:hypothetical protein